MIELAIDVGSGITKVRGPKGKRSFPSLAGPPAEAGFELKSSSGRTVSFDVGGGRRGPAGRGNPIRRRRGGQKPGLSR